MKKKLIFIFLFIFLINQNIAFAKSPFLSINPSFLNKEELKLIIKNANNGDPVDLCILSDIYRYGLTTSDIFIEEDYSKSAKYYLLSKLATDTNDVPLYEGSSCQHYDFNNYLKSGFNNELKKYTASAEKGDIWSQYVLGYMYEHGMGTNINYDQAIKYYSLAADKGHVNSQHHLGDLYSGKGYIHGDSNDYIKAFKYYSLAAEQGLAWSQLRLGEMYKNGLGIDRDYKQAFKYFTIAVSKPSFLVRRISYNELGDLYYYGLGIEQNYNEALSYYLKAYKYCTYCGIFQAKIGSMYYLGQGVDKNYAKAAKYLKLIGDFDNEKHAPNEYRDEIIAEGQLRLGDMYYLGQGVKQSFLESKNLYGKACGNGNQKACDNYKDLNLKGY